MGPGTRWGGEVRVGTGQEGAAEEVQHRRVEERGGAGGLDQTHQPRQHVERHQLLEGRPALPLRRCTQSTHATRMCVQ
jgi:hypothetical protein